MHFTQNLKRGRTVEIVVGNDNFQRIKEFHFRGELIRQAGNFSRWPSLNQLIGNQYILSKLLADLDEAIDEIDDPNRRTDFGVQIECDYFVGWTTHEDASKFQPELLEAYKPNKRSRGMKVRLDASRQIRAPKTTLVTIVYSIIWNDENSCYRVDIWSVHPGSDIGELKGNITARENIVFFDYAHPGQ